MMEEQQGQALLILLRTLEDPPKAETHRSATLSPDRQLLSVLRRTPSTTFIYSLEDASSYCSASFRPIASLEISSPGSDAVMCWANPIQADEGIRTLLVVSTENVAVTRIQPRKTTKNTHQPTIQQPVLAAVLLRRGPAMIDPSKSFLLWDKLDSNPTNNNNNSNSNALFASIYELGPLSGSLFPAEFIPSHVLCASPWSVSNKSCFSIVSELTNGNIAISNIELSSSGLKITKFFTIESTKPTAGNIIVSCINWILFAAEKTNGIIWIFDCRNCCFIGLIDCIFGINDINAIAVSPDLHYLVVSYDKNEDEKIKVLDIEKYFNQQKHPKNRRRILTNENVTLKIVKTIDFESSETRKSATIGGLVPQGKVGRNDSDITFSEEGLRWYEILSSRNYHSDVPTPEFEDLPIDVSLGRGISTRTHPGIFDLMDSLPAITCGLSISKQQQQQPITTMTAKQQGVSNKNNSNCVFERSKPSGVNKKGSSYSLIFASDVIIWLRCVEEDSTLFPSEAWVYSKESNWTPIEQKFDCHPLSFMDGSTWFAITSGKHSGICSFVFGQPEQRVINNLIMFDLSEKADELCELNSWDRHARRLNALELGLKYKQLDVVENALGSLEHDQQIQGIKLLHDHALAVADIPAEEDFTRQLLQIGTQFAISLALRPKVAAASEDPQIEASLGEAFSNSKLASKPNTIPKIAQEMLDITALLSSIRALGAEINNKKAGIVSKHNREPLPLSETEKIFRPEDLFERADADRWSRLGEISIIREALLSSRLPTAIGYLHAVRSNEQLQQKQHFSLEWIRLIASELAYQACCDGNYPCASSLLMNAGINPVPALVELLWKTSRRLMRRGLFSFLQADAAKGRLLPSDKLIEFGSLLETLYPGPSFAYEYERILKLRDSHCKRLVMMISTRRRMSRQQQQNFVQDSPMEIEDLTPNVTSKYGLETVSASTMNSISFTDRTIPITSELDASGFGSSQMAPSSPFAERSIQNQQAATSSPTINGNPRGFARFALKWASNWTQDIKERLLIERDYELTSRNPQSFFEYSLSHNDLEALTMWASTFLDASLRKSVPQNEKRSILVVPKKALSEAGFSEAALDLGMPFTKEHALNELAKRGIILENELEALKGHHSLAFPLIRRVAQGGILLEKHSELIIPNEFHRCVVSLLADTGCLAAMRCYIDFHNLLPPDIQFQDNNTNSWANFISLLCSVWKNGDTALFEAGMINARLLVRGITSLTNEQLLRYYARETADHPLLALALSRYIPSSSSSSSEGIPQDLNFSVPSTYPTLAKALFPQRSGLSPSEITDPQFELFSSNRDITLSALLKKPEIASLCNRIFEKSSAIGPIFVDSELSAAAFAYKLGVQHFIAKGSPFGAYVWLKATTEQDSISKKASESCYDICLRKPGDSLIISAATCLLELCGIDSLSLRIDCSVLDILQREKEESEEINKLQQLISSARTEQTSVLEVIKTLQTLAIGNRARNIDDLTAIFCRAHGLPPPISVLERLASNGDWSEFLTAAGKFSYDPRKVIEVIQNNWKVPSMKDHLEQALSCLVPSSNDSKNSPLITLNISEISNFIRGVEAVERFRADPQSVGSAVKGGLKNVFPFPLSFLHSADSLPIELCITWLKHKAPEIISAAAAQSNSTSSELRSVISQLIFNQEYSVVSEALRLFIPGHPVSYLVDFFICFVQKRFGDSSEQMKSLLSLPQAQISADERNDWNWTIKLSIESTKKLIDKFVELHDVHNLEFLFKSLKDGGLARANISQELTELHTTFSSLRSANAPLELLRVDTQQLISKLVSLSLYSEASATAIRRGIDPSSVYISKANDIIEQHKKQACLWADEKERIELWGRVHRHFLSVGKSHILPSIVVDFFMNRAIISGTTSSEQLRLLSFALAWCTGKQEEVEGSFLLDNSQQTEDILLGNDDDNTANTPEDKSLWCKPNEFVNELRARVALIKVSILTSGLSLPPLGKDGFEGGLTAAVCVIVDKLVDTGKISQAESISNRFNHTSESLSAAKSCLLAASTKKIEEAESAIMETSQMHPQISTFCARVLSDLQVAHELSISFDAVRNEKPLEILSHLSARKSRDLCAGFISTHQIPDSDVATVLADQFCEWVSEHGKAAKRSTKPLRYEIAAEWPRETLVDFASLAPTALSDFAYRVFEVLCSSVNSSTTTATTNMTTTPRHSHKFKSSQGKELTHEAEVELAITSYILLELACNGEGCQAVLSFVISRAPVYSAESEYELLRRLLTGTRAYRDLYTLFDMLADSNRFELLLSGEDKGSPDEESFQAAIVRYLKQRRPNDTDKLQLVCLRFGLFHDIGRRLELSTTERIRSIVHPQQQQQQQQQSPAVIQAQLHATIQELLQAADHYTMGHAYKAAAKCFHLAQLVGLQCRHPESKCLLLSREEAKQLMVNQIAFRDALIVANVYGLRDDWARAVYQQVVCGGNINYIDDLLIAIKLNSTTWWDIVRIYESEVIQSLQQQQQQQQSQQSLLLEQIKSRNMKVLLTKINDFILQFDIATKLHFDDVTTRLRSSIPGLQYFRK